MNAAENARKPVIATRASAMKRQQRHHDEDFYYYGATEGYSEPVVRKKRTKKKEKERTPPPQLDAPSDKIKVELDVVWDNSMSVIEIAERRYVIGPHLAEVVCAESFNLYSQARSKNIPVYRASDSVMEFLVRAGVMKTHAKNVSLLEISAIDEFVRDRMRKREAKKLKRMTAAAKLKSKSSKSAAVVEKPDPSLANVAAGALLDLEEEERQVVNILADAQAVAKKGEAGNN